LVPFDYDTLIAFGDYGSFPDGFGHLTYLSLAGEIDADGESATGRVAKAARG
jgi:hypothetical protein